jgi:predicted Fe-Mo cluster-binding NifX family protein
VPITLAVADWKGRVSPVFDVTERVRLFVVDVDNPSDERPVTARLGDRSPHARARRLVELGARVLVCGAISRQLQTAVIASGIRVIPWVSGNVEEVVRAYRDGALDEARFAMPGCGGARLRRRHGKQRRSLREETEESS